MRSDEQIAIWTQISAMCVLKLRRRKSCTRRMKEWSRIKTWIGSKRKKKREYNQKEVLAWKDFVRVAIMRPSWWRGREGILYFADWTGLDCTSKTRTCKTWTCKTPTSKPRTCKIFKRGPTSVVLRCRLRIKLFFCKSLLPFSFIWFTNAEKIYKKKKKSPRFTNPVQSSPRSTVCREKGESSIYLLNHDTAV